MNLHLAAISPDIAPGRHAALLLDDLTPDFHPAIARVLG